MCVRPPARRCSGKWSVGFGWAAAHLVVERVKDSVLAVVVGVGGVGGSGVSVVGVPLTVPLAVPVVSVWHLLHGVGK